MYPAIFTEVASLLLLILLGFCGKRLRFFTVEMEKGLSVFMLNVCMPCLMIDALTSVELPPEAPMLWRLLGITAAAFAVTLALAYGSSRLITKEREKRRFFTVLMLVCNTGNIGYPVARTLFGEMGAVYAAIFTLASMVLLWTIGVWLVVGQRQAFSWRQLATPALAAVLTGFFLFALQLRLPAILSSTLGKLGDMTGPLAMIIVGCSLAEQQLKELLRDWTLGRFLICKQVLLPAAAFFLLRTMFGGMQEVKIAAVLASMPSAVNLVAFMQEHGQDGKTAARAVLSSTVLSLALLPVFFLMMQRF